MSETRAGLWTAAGAGVALALTACSGPSQYEIETERRDHMIDVRNHQGFEEQVINDWIARHPDERLKDLTPLESQGRFIGYKAVTEKNVNGLDVKCERLPIGQTPTDVPSVSLWRNDNALKTPDKRREEIKSVAINNADHNVAIGYIICSAPFLRKTGVK